MAWRFSWPASKPSNYFTSCKFALSAHLDPSRGFSSPKRRYGMTDWSTADIPSLSGTTAVVTGAAGGLGYETAMALAGAGAFVILTGRSDAKGLRAIEGICERFPNALIAY